jgi:hypothetical protein
MYLRIGLLCWLLFESVTSKAQTAVVMIYPDPKDTVEVQRLNQLGNEAFLQKNGWLNAFAYFGEAYRLAQSIHYTKGEADILRKMTLAHIQLGSNKDEILANFIDEITLRHEIGNQLEIANSYQYLGDYCYKLRYTDEAAGYYAQVALLREKHSQNYDVLMQSFDKAAKVYAEMDSLRQNIFFITKKLKIAQKYQDQNQVDALNQQLRQLAIQKQKKDNPINYLWLLYLVLFLIISVLGAVFSQKLGILKFKIKSPK